MRLLLILLLSLSLSASETRTREILAMFSKTKNVQKSKRGVTKSVFVERHGQPVTGRDVTGTYEVDGLNVWLRLAGNGGYGADRRGAFTLRDIRRSGAYFTATKAYTHGRTERLEGVFMELVTRAGKTPADATMTRTFGLGVLLDEPYVVDGGVHLEKVFYERQ
jgi:hypothetical protein